MPPSDRADTRHARISAEMRQNILSGLWPPGHPLPKETDLAAAHGVSRMTMNKVLTQLSREGLLLRRRRSGTVVAQQRGQSAVMEIADIAQEIAGLGRLYAWRLLEAELRPLQESERSLLDLREDGGMQAMLILAGLHLADGEAFCLETRAINTRIAPAALEADFSTTVPGQWLLHSMPFSAASHRIRAVNALGKDARHLELPIGAACLEILRKTRIDQSWVTHVRLLYPGAAHQLIAEFAP